MVGVKIGKLKQGELTKFGYRLNLSAPQRHEALKKSIYAEGYGLTMKRINALYVLNKNNPSKVKILTEDKNYIRNFR